MIASVRHLVSVAGDAWVRIRRGRYALTLRRTRRELAGNSVLAERLFGAASRG